MMMFHGHEGFVEDGDGNDDGAGDVLISSELVESHDSVCNRRSNQFRKNEGSLLFTTSP